MLVKLLEAKAVPDTSLWGRWNHARFIIAVGNIHFEKEVAIHLDDGREYPARYVEPLNGYYELWECTFPLEQRELCLKFAVRYQVDGQTHWDNNYGWDYVIDRDQPQLLARVFPLAA
ncbi:carbohydrate-binding protein [Hyalangium gracile]|uniref:carbohydrate-binding protein n=1 Tax=Hyalangium gracile TaxID=394092 RepID=UPI001CCBB012|nr:carbohydrate-binding protein [Hyalangium gracile]